MNVQPRQVPTDECLCLTCGQPASAHKGFNCPETPIAVTLVTRLKSGMAWTIADQTAAANMIGMLRDHVNAMCGWAEILAESQQWTRDNANSFWTSYEAARAVARE